MWLRVLFSCSLIEFVLMHSDNDNSASDNVQWGWQMTQAGPGTVGHYFVKLPESEQQVRYIADGSGYHGAVAVTTSDQGHIHTTNFALGERAVELNSQISNGSHINNLQSHSPFDIYLLQQQFPTYGQFFQIVPNNGDNTVQYTSLPINNYEHSSPQQNLFGDNIKHSISKQIQKSNDRMSIDKQSDEIIDTGENGRVVRIFKDHKCSDDYGENKNEIHKHRSKSSNTDLDESLYKQHNEHRSSAYEDIPVSYQDVTLNQNNDNKYNYHSEVSHATTEPVTFTEHDGITKLVASTQNLITNEDLLRINHAAEQTVNHYNDDIIKPRRRSNSRAISFLYNDPQQHSRSRITVAAKYGKVINQNNNKHETPEQSYQTSNNDYKFSSPIVVDDSNYGNYKQQIVNNILSTMVPHIENRYEIINVKNHVSENSTYDENKSEEDLVNITPRPVSQNYLAPLTVALRLFNANHSDVLNSVDDHEPSDSELVFNTAKRPQEGKTIVEIHESIPVEITHINDVEYHEYLDEGRSNNGNSLGLVKTLYQNYIQSLEDAKYTQNEDTTHNNNSGHNENNEHETPNSHPKVQAQASSDNNNDYVDYYNTENKMIQPIIIEKHVPVTKFVDRFIEKQVPYPEPVEVIKQVPVDRPIPVPVHYETIVTKPVEITKYVDKPYPVEVLKPYPVEVRVPFPVEHKVFVDRPIHVPYPVEKVIEKQMIHHIPVPTPVGIPVGIEIPVERKVLYPFPVETPVSVPVPVETPVTIEKIIKKEIPMPYPVEKPVPYPVPYPVEKRIPVPVEKIIEKPVTVTKVIEKAVHIKVPVPQPVRVEVPVPRPYPVDRIVEKKVPYPVHVDRIVEKRVPVNIPYPVKTIVERVVEKPVVITKYIDKPYPVEKIVHYPVEKIVEKKVPYPIHVPVEVKVPYIINREVTNKVQNNQPYQYEKINPPTIYSYGTPQEALTNVANYLRYNQEQYKQAIPNHALEMEALTNQQQAESQRNYQIELANAHILKNLQNAIPVQTTRWGNHYASSYHYLNTTDSKLMPNSNVQNQQKYYGPPPVKNYNNEWEKNQNHTERIRRTEKAPKMANLRIEYGGFKPPLIPSTEVDLDGVPIKKDNQ